jgi:hypothetical protein
MAELLIPRGINIEHSAGIGKRLRGLENTGKSL